VNVEKGHLEIAAHGLEQRGAVEEAGDCRERAATMRELNGRALLGVLAVGIEIDVLGEPLIDPAEPVFMRSSSVVGKAKE